MANVLCHQYAKDAIKKEDEDQFSIEYLKETGTCDQNANEIRGVQGYLIEAGIKIEPEQEIYDVFDGCELQSEIKCEDETFADQIVPETEGASNPRPIQNSFSCSQCDFWTNRKYILEGHNEVMHSNDNSRSCEECNAIDVLKRDVRRHLKMRSWFYCTDCDFKTIYKLNLNRHIKSIHLREKSYFCSRCHYRSTCTSSFVLHRSGHKNEKFFCSHCDYQTEYKWNLKKHLKTHLHRKYPQKTHSCYRCYAKTSCTESLKCRRKSKCCLECEFECSRIRTMRAHEKIHPVGKPTGNQLLCAHCEFKTDSKWNLEVHMVVHLSGEQFKPTHSCSLCEFRTTRPCLLKWHHRRIHLGEDSFTCTVCNLNYSSKSSLARHMKTHSKELHSIRCSECDYTTLHKFNLNIHMSVHHSREPYSCSLCEFKTDRFFAMKRHEKSHPEYVANSLSCKACNLRFVTKMCLRKHLKTHLEERYSCSQCNFKADRLVAIKCHEFLHSKEKVLTCTQCDYKTMRLPNLKRHMLRHSSQKRSYKCSKCSFKTIRMFSFRKHIINHINDKMYFCRQCDFKTPLFRHFKKHIILNHITRNKS